MTTECLIIDCQILQTAAFDRGMGKYTSSLLSSLSKNNEFKNKFKDVYVILNENLNIEKDRTNLIKELIPDAKLKLLNLPVNIDDNFLSKNNDAKNILSEFCMGLKCDNLTYLITAPFFVGFASVFPDLESVKKCCIVYDFIPYRMWHVQRIFPDELYFQHFNTLIEANQIMTISEFARIDLINIFGFRELDVCSIDGGPFKQKPAERLTRPISNKYIIYPSAPIAHKNNENAIEGFERFQKAVGEEYKLVITSTFDKETKDNLSRISPNIIFTGNVSDAELLNYYRHSECVLFASLSEGLGMPVLEAIHYSLPVACSDISVLTEISDTAMYLFNPKDPKSIANALDSAVKNGVTSKQKKEYERVIRKYSWESSAKKLLNAMIRCSNNAKAKNKNTKKNIVVIAGDPRINSRESRLIEYIYAELSKRFNIRLEFEKKRLEPRTKNPSYAYYVAKTKTVDYKPNIILEIEKKRYDVIRNKSLRITLSSENRSFAERSFEIKTRKYDLDKYLQFTDWKYRLHNGERAVDIVNMIENCLKEK